MSTKLVLFFTEGVSLQTWAIVGMLDRELALYSGLARRGMDVELITYGDQLDLKYKAQLSPIEIHCNRFNLPSKFYKQSLHWFPPEGNLFKSNQVAGSQVAMDAARKAGAKFIARCGYLLSDFETRQHGLGSNRASEARKLEEKVFQGADLVVVTTTSIANTVKQNYGISNAKIHVIPNYVDTQNFKPKQKTRNDRPCIISIGRLEQQKNYRTLIEAVAPLDVEMLFVGDGSLRNELQNAAQGSRAKVKFLGNLPNLQLAQLLPTCDIFVLPSNYEGHPKALLEAMSCGLPVIGSRVPGIQELIQDEKNGILSSVDSESLREKILQVLGDDDLRSRLGKAARVTIENNFSLAHILGLEVSLINELTSEKNGPN